MEKKNKKYFPPTKKKTLHFHSFLLLCNAIIHVKDIKVVQFKRKFHYTIRKGIYHHLKMKLDKIPINSKSLILRKGR